MQLQFTNAHNRMPKKSGCSPGLGELPEIWGFPLNISATARASDFTFGTQLGFAKDDHKITPIERSSSAVAERPREARCCCD